MNKLSIFDTHCHLADKEYHKQSQSVKEIIHKAEKVGVKYILNVGQDTPTNHLLIEQLDEFPNLFGALGLHPNSNEDLSEENLQWIEKQLTNQRIIAIGEIGLDYYRTFTDISKQKYWFKKQLELAKKYNLPVLLHIRGKEDQEESMDAFNDAYEIVKEIKIKKGILHCFTGDWKIAQKFMGLGFCISFAGNITYKNAKWQERWGEVIEKVPLEKILVETDAPYLSPKPLRGRINYPQNIVYTLEKIAEIKKMDIKEAGEKIYFNALQVFGLSQ
jgi:TatD DNase family protein